MSAQQNIRKFLLRRDRSAYFH